MSTPTPVTLVGATGLTGSSTFQALLNSTHPFNLTTLTRRSLPPINPINQSTTHTNQTFSDLFEAITSESSLGAPGGVFISCLGTTRGAAGSLKAQERIDVDLNRDLAQKARDEGVDTVRSKSHSIQSTPTTTRDKESHFQVLHTGKTWELD